MVNDEHLPERSGESGDRPGSRKAKGPLETRIRTVLGRDAAKIPTPLNLGDLSHVDAAARFLLKRFYERNDPICFELLVELTHPPVAVIAEDVVREAGLPVAPEVLHGAMLGVLFIDTRPEQVDVRRFLAFAAGKLRTVAEARAAWLARRPIPQLERLPSGMKHQRAAAYLGAPFDSDPPEDPVAIEAVVKSSGTGLVAAAIDFKQLGFDFTWLVETLFHRLEQPARVLLRAHMIEGKSAEQIAVWREADPEQVARDLEAARIQLNCLIESACEGLAVLARRSGCTLAGKPPEEITAEDVARHLISCDACLKSLDAQTVDGATAQARSLAALAASPAGALGVETLIADAHGKGKHAVKALLFELLRAVLAQIPEVQGTAEFLVPPGDTATLTREVTVSIPRLGDEIEAPLPEVRGLAAARTLLRTIEALFGSDDRDYLNYYACVAGRSGQDDVARVTLERLVGEQPGAPHAFAARYNLLRLYSNQQRHQDVLDLATKMLTWGDDVRYVFYAKCRAYAGLHDKEAFLGAANVFRSSAMGMLTPQQLRKLILDDLDMFERQLGFGRDEIAHALGLADLEARG